MHRKPLLNLLSTYRISCMEDAAILRRFRYFVEENSNCFERALAFGHVTGSSWIIDEDRTHALFTYHAKLQKWLQLGGHADGDADVFQVALKEALEESGLAKINPLSEQIFDLDIHLIPGKEKGHYHYDVRFLFEANREDHLTVSSESKELAWIPLSEIEKYTDEPSVLRMACKTKFL